MAKRIGLSLVAITCLWTSGFAEEGRIRLRYDRGSEVAVRGTVVQVRDMARDPIPHGTYLVLQTLTNTIYVHLGPQGRLGQRGAAFSTGESVEVVGSLVHRGGSTILLAREVRKGDTSVTFRNARGFPAAGRRRVP